MSQVVSKAVFTTSCAKAEEPVEKIAWVPIADVQLGMFVHPLSRQSFLLTHAKDLEALRESGVSGLFVDLARSHIVRQPQRSVRAWQKDAGPVSAPVEAAPSAPTGGTSDRRRAMDQAAQTLARVRKPVETLLADVRLGKAVNSDAVVSLVREITDSVDRNASAIISLSRIRSKDTFTYAHSIAVCALMANLARRMDLDRGAQQELAVAGLLHDVGKLMVPEAILNKPGRLTPDETEVMRSHVVRGHEMLKRMKHLPAVALDVCLSHHEKIDGTGYPNRLVGDQISLASRMGAVCDVYDAVTSNRPYKEAWSPAECLANMFSWDGHFDPKILAAFIKSVGIYPVGSLVRMESGHLAVVLEQNDGDLTKPLVRLFYSIPLRARIAFRDLVLDTGGDAVLSRENPRNWGFLDWDQQWPRMLAV